MLLLLLSCFSHVRLWATPYTAAHWARHPRPPGFSRQEHWSELPFPSPMHEIEKWKWSHSHVQLLATPWTEAYQAPPSMGFSRWEYWSGMPLPSLDEWIDGSYLITWTNFGLHYLLTTLLCSQTSRRGQVSVLCIPRISSALLGLSVDVCLSHQMLSFLWWMVSIVRHCVSSS